MGTDATKHSCQSAILCLCQQKSRRGYELIRDCNDDISLSLVLTHSDFIENQFDPLMDMVDIFISRPFSRKLELNSI